MIVGYARVSTESQSYSLEAQIDKLSETGCERVFSESVSSVDTRPEFKTMIEFVRDGDTVVVCRLDRFARSITDLWNQISILKEKGVGLRVLDMNLDTNTPTGKLMISLLGAINQFEREILLDRQRIGIQKAKEAGKYKGRAPTARSKTGEIQSLHRSGMKPSQIAKELGVSRASVYRYL